MIKGVFILIVVTVVIGLLTNSSLAQVRKKCDGKCGGKYHRIKPTEEELKKILADHEKWFETVYKPAFKTNPLVNPQDLPQEGRANLCGAMLWGANLSGVNLGWANLREAKLYYANLTGTDLRCTNLSGAELRDANLSGAMLAYANLCGARLMDTDLSNAILRKANMDSVMFELKYGAFPLVSSIVSADNLFRMWYNNSPHSLVELREACKKAGLRRQEREITYAIEHTKTKKQISGEEGTWGKVLGCLKFIGFELTSDYGMSPGRPLLITLGLIFISAFPYWFALLKREERAGIWQVWDKERVLKSNGQDESVRLSGKGCKWRGFFRALQFSLLSAFHLGWREFNVGSWLVRMQGREYTLQATGWVRTVSGVQSLISVYMLALSVLTYFGRPFE